MISLKILFPNSLTFSNSNPSLSSHRSNPCSIPHSLRVRPLESQSVTVDESLNFPIQPLESLPRVEELPSDTSGDSEKDDRSRDEDLFTEEKPITGIHVPRQRHISVSKAELLRGILSLFDSQESANEFLRVSMCLDSIIHAEHKVILEEMRIDYSLTQLMLPKGNATLNPMAPEKLFMSKDEEFSSPKEIFGSEKAIQNEKEKEAFDQQLPFQYGIDLRVLLDSYLRNSKRSFVGKTRFGKANSIGEPRVAAATRFQHAFMKLLRDAQFEELSAHDLRLTSALNNDYILTLPIYVNWKKASESNAIIFRRGYATERQKGLLIVEKLDYIQSKLLQRIFFILSRPMKEAGKWINEALKSTSQFQEMENWLERSRQWLRDLSLPQNIGSATTNETIGDYFSDADDDLPIWLAAQRAVSRYEGLLTSELGPRGRLLRKLFRWTGFVPSIQETNFNIDNANKVSEPYTGPNSLPRISLSDIWKPATREACGNNLWKMFKTSLSILFSQSLLQEPAFEELILLYSVMGERESEDKEEIPSLQMKIFEKIPIPDLPVVFPHKKLSFRILDTVRLDAASIVGLLAFLVNYKFEDVLSSPSAILLDVIAISALIIYVTRVSLGYKQTWDRYQLLVNKTLYEKTLASGFGSVHFLLDASEQQLYKEAILAYAILLRLQKDGAVSCNSISDTCERFLYDKFQEKVDMPIDKALETLMRLGLVKEEYLEGNVKLQALSSSNAYEALKQRWDRFLG